MENLKDRFSWVDVIKLGAEVIIGNDMRKICRLVFPPDPTASASPGWINLSDRDLTGFAAQRYSATTGGDG